MTSPSAALDLAVRLRAAAAVLHRLAAGAGPVDDWSGAAADAYAVTAAGLRRRAAAVTDVLDDLARQLDGVAARLPEAAPQLVSDLVHARLLLEVERDLAEPRGSDDRAMAEATRRALDRIASASDPVTGRPVEAQLLAYDPAAFGGEGRVVVAAGDPATADHVAVLVPGLGTDATDAPVHARRALDVHLAARRADPADGNAVVAWLGYDAPEGAGVLTGGMAREGGQLLADQVEELRADRAGDPVHLTVVGHSYGATTVAHAATGPGLAADDVVLAGSPGAGDARSAADLGTRPGHVWVLRNSLDPVAALGASGPVGLGEDPALDDWGAIRLRAESAPREAGGGAWDDWPLADHASYFEPGGEGIRSLAHVVSGHPERAEQAPPVRDPWWSPPVDPELGRSGRTPADPVAGRVR